MQYVELSILSIFKSLWDKNMLLKREVLTKTLRKDNEGLFSKHNLRKSDRTTSN